VLDVCEGVQHQALDDEEVVVAVCEPAESAVPALQEQGIQVHIKVLLNQLFPFTS